MANPFTYYIISDHLISQAYMQSAYNIVRKEKILITCMSMSRFYNAY